MIVVQLFMANPLANFNYLIACPETGRALAVDPLDGPRVMEEVQARGWSLQGILNTHEHDDHTAGNTFLREATGAVVMAHRGARSHLDHLDREVGAGDVVRVGKTVELQVLDTPGHTFAHVCLRARGQGDALFAGDTLFNAGVGNCRGGGDPATLYETVSRQLRDLPAETVLWPGHAYAANNLRFCLDREPGNPKAKALLAEVEALTARGEFLQASFGLEREINPFFRLDVDEVVQGLKERFPDRDLASPKARFMALRELRDRW